MSDTQAITTELQHGQEIAARDATIADLRQQIAAKDVELKDAAENIGRLDATIAELRGELTKQGEQIATLEAAAKAQAGPEAPPVPDGTPQEIMLTAPYGFIDDHGVNRSWPAGARVRNRTDVATLIARKADHTVTEGAPAPPAPPASSTWPFRPRCR